ncbi:hypothetical protein HWV62_26444 [Athelia sp. TMB]|nr:hypothetical protein HWV62_26444 [Athelia sp. TMB]
MVAPDAQRLASLSLQMSDIPNARNVLSAHIETLDAKFHCLQAEYNYICSKTAAITTLPNELLVLIFQEARKSGDYPGRSVAQVSRHWREIATRTPQLWTDIYIGNLEMAALYMERSKALPFDVRVRIPPLYSEVETLGQLLIRHIARCRRLTIVFATSAGRKLFDFLRTASAPLLVHIDISCTIYTPFDVTTPARIFIGGSPMLQTLRIISFPWLLPPLQSVTALYLFNIHPFSPEDLRSAFLTLRSLVTLEVVGEIATAWIAAEAVELPALRTLKLTAEDDQDHADQFRGLYEAIEAPSLEFLSLRKFGDEDLDFLSDLMHTRPKFPALRMLALFDADGIALHLGRLMGIFSQVETVVFDGDACLLLSILHDKENEIILPCTRKLTILHLVSSLHELAQPIYNCITARIKAEMPISELVLPDRSTIEAMGVTALDGGPPLKDLVSLGIYDANSDSDSEV